VNEPTLGEVMRTLSRIEAEIGRRLADLAERLDQMVTRDAYEEYRAAVSARMQDLDEELRELQASLADERRERRADRRMVWGAILGALGALVVAVIAAAVGVQ